MYDYYKNYDYGFILMGIMITFSGLMLYPIPCVQRRFKVQLPSLSTVQYSQRITVLNTYKAINLMNSEIFQKSSINIYENETL